MGARGETGGKRTRPGSSSQYVNENEVSKRVHVEGTTHQPPEYGTWATTSLPADLCVHRPLVVRSVLLGRFPPGVLDGVSSPPLFSRPSTRSADYPRL